MGVREATAEIHRQGVALVRALGPQLDGHDPNAVLSALGMLLADALSHFNENDRAALAEAVMNTAFQHSFHIAESKKEPKQ